jgi:hypothetical protein
MSNAGSSSTTIAVRKHETEFVGHAVECADCRKAPATRTFLHMTKGHFPLCDDCFMDADHEEDYLEYCDGYCRGPPPLPDAPVCRHCERLVRRCSCRSPWHAPWDAGCLRCVNCSGVADRFFAHKTRFDRFHEELMAKAWHPSRVARWLEHGEEVLDMMLGVD